jgi:hypothetical protein
MDSMLQRLTLIAFVMLPCLAFGQFGISARYQSAESARQVSMQGIHAGVEYHFRLKTNRIEFRPMLGYRRSFTNDSDIMSYSSIDFDFNTSIYPFDFEGDCDCPTFSKQGTLVKKGFFFEIQPGIGHQTITHAVLGNRESSNMVFKLGGAAGLDIGLSDRFTITPFVSGTQVFSGEWEILQTEDMDGQLDEGIQFGGGLRLSYSVDEKKRRRRN